MIIGNSQTIPSSFDLWESPIDWLVQRPTVRGPTDKEIEKYPALGESWARLKEEYEIIRNLTLGNK